MAKAPNAKSEIPSAPTQLEGSIITHGEWSQVIEISKRLWGRAPVQ